MKKSLMLAMSVMAMMTACTSNEVNDIINNQEITFQVATYSSQTKALPDGVTNYDAFKDASGKYIPFGTYAWFYEDGQAFDPSKTTNQGQPFMKNEKISHDANESLTAWKPSVVYYWPKSGSIDFISYSPYDASYTTAIDQKSVKFEGTVNQTEDLMYADKAVGKTKNIKTCEHQGVPTLFRHALAKINFKVVQDAFDDKTENWKEGDPYTEWAIAVSKIEALAVQDDGFVQFTLDNDDPEEGNWNMPEGNVWTWKHPRSIDREDADVLGFAPAEWGNTDSHNVHEKTIIGQLLTDKPAFLNTGKKNESSNFFVMPQALLDSSEAYDATHIIAQTIKVTYSIITKQPNGEIIVENKTTSTTPAKIGDLKAWEINKNITYFIHINPLTLEPITFDPAVADWDRVEAYPTINM